MARWFVRPRGTRPRAGGRGAADGARRAARAPGIAPEHAISGIVGVRAHSDAPDFTREMLGALGFEDEGMGRLVTSGTERRGLYLLDERPASPGDRRRGDGAPRRLDLAGRRPHRLGRAGCATPGGRRREVIDRQYFHSIYFHEPGGVLFEMATPARASP